MVIWVYRTEDKPTNKLFEGFGPPISLLLLCDSLHLSLVSHLHLKSKILHQRTSLKPLLNCSAVGEICPRKE